MEEEKLKRGKSRIIGGVCSTLAKKYNTEPWILRIGLIIISVFFYYLIFVYLIAWLTIPNKVKVGNKKQSRIQLLGLIIGGILGAFLLGGFTYLISIMNNDPANGGIAPVLLAFIGIPVGMVVGFSIARAIAEKKSLNEKNIP